MANPSRFSAKTTRAVRPYNEGIGRIVGGTFRRFGKGGELKAVGLVDLRAPMSVELG